MTPPARPAHRELVVAIDGPASSGKSSVGAAAAARLGYRFFDTGLLYRAITWLAIERGVGEDDPGALAALTAEIDVAADADGRLSRILVGGRDVSAALRTPEVDAAVSAFSQVPEVRAALLDRQRALAAAGGIVMAGRDVGTVVLPDADLKLYLDASADERARRRAAERGIAPDAPEAAEILASLRRRDAIDAGRATAPLRAAPDARVIRTDGNAFETTVDFVVAAIQAARTAAIDGDGSIDANAAIDGASGGRRASSPRRRPATHEDPPAQGISPFIFAGSLAARIGSRCVTRVRLRGALDAIPREGPVILAVNHASNADPVVVGGFLTPLLGRRMHWLGKREMFDWPIVGWLAPHGGVHPVDRGAADIEAFKTARRVLDGGAVLTIFPEGTRSRDGRLGRALEGAAVLAMRTRATVVPIGIAGSHRVWPRGRKVPRIGGRITVTVGQPFRLDEAVAEALAARNAGSAGTAGSVDASGTGTAGSARGAGSAGDAGDASEAARPRRRSAERRAEAALGTEILMRRIAELLPPGQRGPYAEPAVEAEA